MLIRLKEYKERYHFSVNYYSLWLLITFIPDFFGLDNNLIRFLYWGVKLLLACWVIAKSKSSFFFYNRNEALFIFVFVIYTADIFIDVFVTPLHKFEGSAGAIDFIGFILIIILALSFRYDPSYHSEKSFWFFTLSLTTGLIISYFNAIENHKLDVTNIRYDANTTINSIWYGQMGCALSLASLHGFIKYRKTQLKIFFIVSFLIGMLSIAKAGSRSPVVVLALVMSFYFIAKLGGLKALIILCILGSLIIIFINPIVDLLTSMGSTIAIRLTHMVEEGEGSGREVIYQKVLNIIYQAPILGSYYLIPSGPFAGMYAHNFFLEVFMATGLLGGIPFTILIVISLVKSFRLIRVAHPASWLIILYLQILGYGMFSTGLYSSQDFWALLFYMMSMKSCPKRVSRKLFLQSSINSSPKTSLSNSLQ